ncbi:MAG: hypothetical protein ABI878_05980 [Acidobacteriota bacterium]
MIRQGFYLVLFIVFFLSCPLPASLQIKHIPLNQVANRVVQDTCQARVDAAVKDRDSRLTGLQNQNDELKAQVSKLASDLKNLSAGKQPTPNPEDKSSDAATSELNSKIAELQTQIASKDAKIVELEAPNRGTLGGQCLADPAQALSALDTSKRTGDTSGEYYGRDENGQKFQARDLLIGTLLFPDPSTLEFQAGKPAQIEVIFRPRILGDNQTKWFVNVQFVKNQIDFQFDASGGALRREITTGGEIKWIWNTKAVSPEGFARDLPRIIVEAGFQKPGGEEKVNIEDRTLSIKEKVEPGFLLAVWSWVVDHLYGFLSGLLGLISTILLLILSFLSISKTRIEKEKAALELTLKQKEAGP